MRQVLFRIPWDNVSIGGLQIPLFGWGILLLVWCAVAAWVLYLVYWRPKTTANPEPGPSLDLFAVIFWLAVAVGILQAPTLGPRFAPDGLPIFGYGMMLLCGLMAGIALANARSDQARLPKDTIWDLAGWLFIPGIMGARLFYLVQYHDRVYARCQTVTDYLWATVALSEGGIVLYGGLIAGAVSYFVFCAVRGLRPLELADVITPSVFVGIGFGRIGCLLNGCCFGDYCPLPWGIEFPAGSGPFSALVYRGFLSPDAPHTPPLHPTQIYSAVDGFVLAAVTLWYTPLRRTAGDVFCVGLILSSITRFMIEFIRGDEYGQWGTTFTISQWISATLFLLGVGLQIYLTWKAKRPEGANRDLPVAPPQGMAAAG